MADDASHIAPHAGGYVQDDFSGAGGWIEGMTGLPFTTVGVELDRWASASSAAAGHRIVRADVRAVPFRTDLDGYTSSPPCPDFSTTGRRGGLTTERGQLVYTPLHRAQESRPRWIACEQVPPVLHIWRQIGRELEALGYRWWAGVLCAADFGLPQMRRRAVLIASLTRQPASPAPTHSAIGGTSLFDSLERHVTMAEGLGWPDDHDLHTNRGQAEDGTRQVVTCGRAAATVVTGKAGGQWWRQRPATTVVGTFSPTTIAPPKYRTKVSRQNDPDAIKVTTAELARLQGFRPDFPWQGPRSAVEQQIGNAVPPALARAIVLEASR